MKLITESGEILALDEAKEAYVAESADSETSISAIDADKLLDEGTLQMVSEEDLVEAKSKKTETIEDSDEADEDEDEDEVEEAVDPKAKKLKKKKISTDDDSEAEVFEEDEAELEINVKEDIDAMFHGEKLSEDFKSKASTIVEAAVQSHVKAEVSKIQEKTDEKIAKQVAESTEALTTKLDGYLDYMVSEWMEDNKLAVEHGIKNEIMEEFVDGMKSLFENHYVDIPQERYNVIDEQATEIDSLKEELNAELNKNIETKQQLDAATASNIFSEVTEELADTEVEKMRSLAEDMDFEGVEDYTKKLSTLKESYFPSEEVKAVVVEGGNNSKMIDQSDSMSAILASLSQKSTF